MVKEIINIEKFDDSKILTDIDINCQTILL